MNVLTWGGEQLPQTTTKGQPNEDIKSVNDNNQENPSTLTTKIQDPKEVVQEVDQEHFTTDDQTKEIEI